MADVYDLIASVNALMPAGTLKQIGAEHYSEHYAEPQRVLWVPMPDAFDAPPNRGWSARRPILRCTSRWSVLCAAKADDALDPHASMRAATVLRDLVIAALDRVAPGDYAVTGGQFEAQDGSTLLQAGRLYILQVSITTAVLETEYLVPAPVTSVASTVDLPPENGSRIAMTVPGPGS